MVKSNTDTDFLSSLKFEPLTKENWNKFVQLFGKNGACGNCWCMYYRLSKPVFDEGKTADGHNEELPIAWCAFAPREDFSKIERSRVHKRIDNNLVWSILCTFIDKRFRRQGVSVELLKGVIKYAREKGIKIIEAYPTIPTQEKLPDSFAWIGLYKSFEKAGFEIVDRTSKNRPMVRYYLD